MVMSCQRRSTESIHRSNSSSMKVNYYHSSCTTATKLSKTSTTTAAAITTTTANTTTNGSMAQLFSQIVATLPTYPSISSYSSSNSSPIKNQTIISNRFSRQEHHPLGKVKVILQISNSQQKEDTSAYLKVDCPRKHLTLYDPTLKTSYEQNQRPTAPKIFAFDAIVHHNSGESNSNNRSLELSKAALPELIDAVMNGNDAVLFAFGKTGTHETMLSADGLMVYSINWLFSALKASKRRFAIKCSAAQINHNSITDMLAQHHSSSSSSSPPTSLSSPICTSSSVKLLKSNTVLSQLREISCISAKRAAHCLDISANYNYTKTDHNSMLFTLHLYQYKIIQTANGKNTVGGRSKLHVLDLCPATKNLMNILLAIFNGQKHVPNKESKLTAVLKECLSSMLVWTSVVANITNAECNYLDTLTTCQFVTRIHRSRIIYNSSKNRIRRFANNYANNFSESSATATRNETDASETESAINCYTSSSEHSVDTVIFCGKSSINHAELPSANKLYHTMPSSTAILSSKQVQTNQQKQDQQQREDNRRVDTKQTQETQILSPNHRTKDTKKSDEVWVDGPKKNRRKKDHQLKWSQELWVDGPNAKCIENTANNASPNDTSLCFHEEKQQRIQLWIQQHTRHIWSDFPCSSSALQTSVKNSGQESGAIVTKQTNLHLKSPEMFDACCQTDSQLPSAESVTATPSISDCSFDHEDPLKVLSDDELFGLERITDSGRDAMSDCCDKDFAINGVYSDNDDCQSEPITEPPKQLKLEQFLQQLTTITKPHLHPHQQSHRIDVCSHIMHDQEYNRLRHPDGASDYNMNLSQWELKTDNFNDLSSYSYTSTFDNTIDSLTNVNSKPLSPQHSLLSANDATIFITSSPNHAVLPTSPRVNRLLSQTTISSSHSSLTKCSVSKKQQKIEQQFKRNTTSTTTSGHGTTSEGECSSVAKKTSSVSSPSFISHHPVVQRQPASSGYESTIIDDDSDRELVSRTRDNVVVVESGNGSAITTPVKMRNKSKVKTVKQDHKRLSSSSSSGHCSFLCCKFIHFDN